MSILMVTLYIMRVVSRRYKMSNNNNNTFFIAKQKLRFYCQPTDRWIRIIIFQYDREELIFILCEDIHLRSPFGGRLPRQTMSFWASHPSIYPPTRTYSGNAAAAAAVVVVSYSATYLGIINVLIRPRAETIRIPRQ